jgi:osmotically-inducible protein OsmY
MPGEISAQMFGNRSLGRPLTRPSQRARTGQATGTEDVGQILGTERFLRGNRSTRDFVGSDARDRTSFVGEQSAEVSGPVVSAVRDLRPQREVNVNQTLRRPNASQLYYPRLRVSFDYQLLPNQSVNERIQQQLWRTETLQLRSPIEVSVADGTATLRGTVAAARDREMVALLVQFEPGISAVRNELVVQSPVPAPPVAIPPEPAETPTSPR